MSFHYPLAENFILKTIWNSVFWVGRDPVVVHDEVMSLPNGNWKKNKEKVIFFMTRLFLFECI